MARIRSIKPQFFDDRRLARDLTREQRLFYVGLWNQADDEGRLVADNRKLIGAIYPYDTDLSGEFPEDVLRRLAETGRAVLYEIDGERYCQLTKFAEHQKISHPTESRMPAPPADLAHTLGWLRENSGTIPEPLRPDVEVEGEEEGDRDEGVGHSAQEVRRIAISLPSGQSARDGERREGDFIVDALQARTLLKAACYLGREDVTLHGQELGVGLLVSQFAALRAAGFAQGDLTRALSAVRLLVPGHEDRAPDGPFTLAWLAPPLEGGGFDGARVHRLQAEYQRLNTPPSARSGSLERVAVSIAS